MSYNVVRVSNSELRADAREKLKGNWGPAVLTCLISGIILGGAGSIPPVGSFLSLLLSGAFLLGMANFFLTLVRGENATIEQLFTGFQNYVKSLILFLLISIFIFLWSLLLIIPGIVAGLSYSQAFYILQDNPNLTSSQALQQSKEMMRGNKGQLFLLYLSFFGWFLLCLLTLGIGFLWLYPYAEAAKACFYGHLKNACKA